MSKEQVQEIAGIINWVGKTVVGLMICFCTFVLNQVWTGYKEHELQDQQTAKTVVEHGQQLQAISGQVNSLNEKVDKIVYLKNTYNEKN